MTTPTKQEQYSRALMHLGYILRPVEEMLICDRIPELKELSLLGSTLSAEAKQWHLGELTTFFTVGATHMRQSHKQVLIKLSELGNALQRFPPPFAQPHRDALKEVVASIRAAIVDELNRVPLDYDPEITPPNMPFTVSLKISDAITTAQSRIHVFDRYLDDTFFPLYLRHVNRTREIRLVTTQGNSNFGVRNVDTLAMKAAGEFDDFQLIQVLPADLHDRNLRIDDQCYYLGPSVKDAGKSPANFGPGTSTPSSNAVLDDLISNGTIVHTS